MVNSNSIIRLVDAHAHLDSDSEGRKEQIELIEANEIMTICCSNNEEEYLRQKEELKDAKSLIGCFGIHPMCAHLADRDVERYREYIKETPMLAEMGLDFHWVEDKTTYPKQVEIFKSKLKLNGEYNKTLNLHTKGAEKEIYDILKKYDSSEIIIHWYDGPYDILKRLIDLGAYFTVSVDIGYNKFTDTLIDEVPLNRILTETDGPGNLEWIDPTRTSSPLYVKNVLEYIAARRNADIYELADMIYTATRGLLR